MRRNHREGRPSDAARGRLRPRVHEHVTRLTSVLRAPYARRTAAGDGLTISFAPFPGGQPMRFKMLVLSLVAALACAGAATAGNGKGHFLYAFTGQLTSTPSNGGVSINVEGGNRAALRAMLGAPVTQTFAYDSTTEFLKWSAGKPTVVQPGDLATGDYVRVNVRTQRGADLASIEQQAAGIVGDHGTTLYKPNMPLYLFRGTLSSVGTSSVSVHVTG